MNKALQLSEDIFLVQKNGKIEIWNFLVEEIIEAVNKNAENELPAISKLRGFLLRYLKEGVSDTFLDELNSLISSVHYSKCIIPSDMMPSKAGLPRNGYIAQYDRELKPDAYAADEFSKLLTTGMLKRLKVCQVLECKTLFLGPPQSKWCSKACGSKFRVQKKRKRDKE